MRRALMAGEASTGIEDNILAAMVFRKTLGQVMRPYAAVNSIISQLGGDEAQVRQRFEGNDPHLSDELRKYCDALGDADKSALRSYVDSQHDELWEVISADKFPVLLPFVTMLPFWMAIYAFAKEGREPEASDFEQIMEQYSDEFLQEDVKLYKMLLEGWIAENRNRHDEVARAVQVMLGLCAVRSIEPFAKNLLVSTGPQQVLVTIDDEERGIIESWKESNESEFLRTYSEWLRLKGYPLLADRTLALDASSATGDEKPRWWKSWERKDTLSPAGLGP